MSLIETDDGTELFLYSFSVPEPESIDDPAVNAAFAGHIKPERFRTPVLLQTALKAARRYRCSAEMRI